eukprot:scaffold6.g2871.t1
MGETSPSPSPDTARKPARPEPLADESVELDKGSPESTMKDSVEGAAAGAAGAGPPHPAHHHHHLDPDALGHLAAPMVDLKAAASARLFRRSVDMLEDRVEALENHTLAPPPEPEEPEKRHGLLINSWVLAIMAGIVAIMIVAKGRIHVPAPLEDVHATNGLAPFVLPAPNDYVDYLFVNMVLGPYLPQENAVTSSSSSGRRKLAAWVGAALAQRDARRAGAAGAALGPPTTEDAEAQLAGAGRERPHPPLITALHTPTHTQICDTKEDRAVTCSFEFRGDDLNASLWLQGEPLWLGFTANQSTQACRGGRGRGVVFSVQYAELKGLGPAKNWLSIAIVILVLIGIASERIHRMWCAMIGCGLMLGLLLLIDMAPSLEVVTEWLDQSTLGLLFGMMIIVGRLKDTGTFEVFSAFAVRISRGRMWILATLLMVTTGFVSAWLDNVTTMLLMAPVSISMMRQCNANPVPLLMAQVLMSNIGGTATMVGDPPALIIGNALSYELNFVDFIANMAPGVIMASAVCIPLMIWIYRRTLTGPAKKYRILDWNLMAKCSYVTGVVLVGFLLHPIHHVDPAWFAILGAIVLCVVDNPMEVDKVVHSVEWDMLLFFAAMFVMIAASAQVGMIDMIGGWLDSAIRSAPEGSRTIVAIQILLWVSMAISGVLDNIPYTITMVPVIEYLAASGLGLDLATLAWALNFGACFGGNATLIGASANIVTATLSERAGLKGINFVSWLKIGVPVTIVSVAVADLWMILRFCL